MNIGGMQQPGAGAAGPFGGMDPALEQMMAQAQMAETLKMYNGLVEKCFETCVQDFSSMKLSKKEHGCVGKCTEKFMAYTARVGQRFQEQNAMMNQQ